MTDLARIRRPRPSTGAGLLLGTLALLLAMLGCDDTDGGWDGSPTGPAPGPPLPDLAVTVGYEPAAGDHVNAGEPITFRVDLANAGPGAADSVAVLVTLPEQVELQSTSSTQGIYDEASTRWFVGRLENGASGQLLVNTAVSEGTVGEELVFTASLDRAAPGDTTTVDNSAVVRVMVNHPPDASDDAYTLAEGAEVTVPAPGVLSNDLDQEGEGISLDILPVDGPFRGQLTLQSDGGFVYDHDGSEAAADSFRYRIEDASAESDTAMVRLEILPVNDLPVFGAIEGYTIAEGETFAPIDLRSLASDDDHPDEELVWQVLDADALSVSISDEDVLTVTTPGPEWYGSDTLLFRVRDPEGAVATANVTFTVLSVNDPPVVSTLPSQTVVVGGSFLPIRLDDYVGDIDHADDVITWTASGQEPLLVTISPARILTVEPPSATWTGSVSITLRATDPAGDWDEQVCRFEVVESR
jgi:uncharacterized repeat protein (TIGR01451 family)